MAVADYRRNTGEGCEFLGSALRIASSRDDAGFGIAAMGAANVGARFAVGFSGDTAGIHDDHVGFGGSAFRCSGISEEGCYSFAVRAGRTAAEVLDVKRGGHKVSLLNPRC